MKNRQNRKPVKRLLAWLFVAAIVISFVPFSTLLNTNASAINSDYTTNDITIQGDNSSTTATISEGQVWAGKNVTTTDSATGNFGIKLSALGGRIAGSDGTALINGNLVITDVVGSGFEFNTAAGGDKIVFQLDGALKEAVYSTDDTSYKHYMFSDASTGISVEFNVYKSNYEVIYTIPAAQLKLADAGNSSSAVYNTLSYGVILSNSAINSTYYTNTSGCKADFSANTMNPYYYAAATSSTGTQTTRTYTKTQEIGEWGSPTVKKIPGTFDWLCNYHIGNILSGYEMTVSSVIINGTTYTSANSSIDTDMHLGYYTVEVTVPGTVTTGVTKTETFYSFSFHPDITPEYNNLTLKYTYAKPGSSNTWKLSPASALIAGKTYTNISVSRTSIIKDYYGLSYYDVTISDSNNVFIAKFNFSPYYDDSRSGSYTISRHCDHAQAEEQSTYTWIVTTPAVKDFTFAPSDTNPTSVNITKSSDPLNNTSINLTAVTPTSWTGLNQISSTLNANGSTTTVTRNYTLSYATTATSANLTVNYSDTTATTGYWKNSACSNGAVTLPLTACGVISLKNNIGSLQITNSVSNGMPGQTFDFSVKLGASLTLPTATLSRWDTDLNTLGVGTPVEDLSKPVSLGDKDQLLITNITNGTTYAILENSVPGYSTQVTVAASGTISGGQTTAVAYNNVFNTAPLTVGKSVLDTESATHSNDIYSFTATFTLPAGVSYQNISYEINDYSAGTTSATALVGEALSLGFDLADGDTISFINIPVNTQYQVAETTSDSAIVSHSINGTVSKGKTAIGSILAGSNSVQFTNDYVNPAPLTISKTVTADNNFKAVPIPESFDYEIYFYTLIVDQDKLKTATDELTTANGALTDAQSALKAALSSYDSTAYDSIDANNAPAAAISLLGSLISGFDSTDDISGQLAGAISDAVAAQGLLETTDPNYTMLGDLITALNNIETAGIDAALTTYCSAKSTADLKQAALTAAQKPSKEVAYNLPANQLTYGDIDLIDGTNTTDGIYTFALQQNQSISFVYLPIDTYYQVTEQVTGANYTTISVNSATVSDTRSGGSLTNSGKILWDGLPTSTVTPISVQYTNDYSIATGTLQVTKTVNGKPAWRSPAEGYSFTVEIWQGGVKDNKITADITLLAGGSAYISDLLPGTTYKVTENTTGMSSSVINDPSNGKMQLVGFSVQLSAVTCVNTYDAPVIQTSKAVDGFESTVANINEPVTYDINVTYDNAQNASSIVIFDPMFSETNSGSITVDYGKTDALSGYSLNADILTLYLDNSALNETTNTITISYKVSFGSIGEYYNTARSEVFYKANPEAEATYLFGGPASNETSVTVHNGSLYPGCLTLTNTVAATGALYWLLPGTWDYTVTFEQTGVIAPPGARADADGKTFYVSLTNGETVMFSGLSEDTTYTVTETTTGMNKVTMNGTEINPISAKMLSGKDSLDNEVVLGQIVKCVNTYSAPALTVDKTANDQKNLNVVAGSTVNYNISIEYDHPAHADTIKINDTMFEKMNTGSLKVFLDKTELTETDNYELLVDSITKTKYLAIYPDSFGEEVSGKITITYSVAFSSAGTFSNTAKVSVKYAPFTKTYASNDTGLSLTMISNDDTSSVPAEASSTAVVNVYFQGEYPSNPSPSSIPSDDESDVAGDQTKPDDTSPSPTPSGDTAVAGEIEKLPQTGGISTSTLLALLGLTLIAAGGSAFIIIRKKNHGKNS